MNEWYEAQSFLLLLYFISITILNVYYFSVFKTNPFLSSFNFLVVFLASYYLIDLNYSYKVYSAHEFYIPLIILGMFFTYTLFYRVLSYKLKPFLDKYKDSSILLTIYLFIPINIILFLLALLLDLKSDSILQLFFFPLLFIQSHLPLDDWFSRTMMILPVLLIPIGQFIYIYYWIKLIKKLLNLRKKENLE